jgi:hypothetical protein
MEFVQRCELGTLGSLMLEMELAVFDEEWQPAEGADRFAHFGDVVTDKGSRMGCCVVGPSPCGARC